ncbi:MAG: hypothetical protein WD645_05285 [Dehalococcoidia bacterium]
MDVCHWHPDRETGLHCGNCDKAICWECVRQHPVGVRCKECARLARLPTYQMSTSYLLRGIAAAVGLGLAGAIALPILDMVLPFGGFFFFIIMFGVGYVIGEGVGAAVNRRRGRPYQFMALGGALLAVGPQTVLALFAVSFGALFTVLGAALAAYAAWHRLAP